MATLIEYKSDTYHYFIDENGQKQGEFKWWHDNGQLSRHCFFVDGKRHGEFKSWYENGQPCVHCFYQNGEVVVDFFTEPDLCPVTDEVKTYFALKYGWSKWL
jgi:antitoxin component YwqK of YwqJK toxin-antitoxin module